MDLKDFWHRFQSGIDVAVSGDLPDKSLGVRDGFLRYFEGRTALHAPLRVLPLPEVETRAPPPLGDAETLALARLRAHALRDAGDYAFYVGSETGVLPMPCGGEVRQIIRCWTVVLGLDDEAWGASGSIQLPQRLLDGLAEDRIPHAVPGRRRSGGMMSSLTGGLETRRTAIAQATFNALSTLTYGLHESRPAARGRPLTPSQGLC